MQIASITRYLLLGGLLSGCASLPPKEPGAASDPSTIRPPPPANQAPAKHARTNAPPKVIPGPVTRPSTPEPAAPADNPVSAAPQPAAGAGLKASRPHPAKAPVIRCGQRGRKQVALTFDDGPSRRYTPKILAILKRYGIKATFFVLGRPAARHPALLRRIEAEGHLLATHSWDHPKRLKAEGWRRQFRRTDAALKKAGVVGSVYYRPPHGILNPTVEKVCAEHSVSIILYTLLSSDWRRPGVEVLTRQVVKGLRDGGIVVLHDGGGNRQQTVSALPKIIAGLRKKGLEPVSLSTLLERPGLRRCSP